MKNWFLLITVCLLAATVHADYYVNVSVHYGIYNNTGTGGCIPNIGDVAVIQLFYVGANGTADYANLSGGITGTAADGDDVLIGSFTFTNDDGTGFKEYAFPATGTISNDLTGYLGANVYGRLIAAGQDGVTSGDWYYQGAIFSANDKVLPGNPPATPDVYALDGGVAGQWVGGQVGGTPVSVDLIVASEHGAPVPGLGTNSYTVNDAVASSVSSPVLENGTNYLCTGWTGTGDVPSSGYSTNTGEFIITEDSSITWGWAVAQSVNVSVSGSGSVSVSDGFYLNGTNLTFTATPDAGWLFMGWSGDVAGDYTTASTNIVIDSDKTITATFSTDADGDGLTNAQEDWYGTNPRNADTDGDGLADWEELRNIVAWGDNFYKQTVVPSNVVNAVRIAAGGGHGMALLATDQIVAWGDNSYQQCDVPDSVTSIAAIAAGETHSMALLSNGTVIAWGDNFYQQTNVLASASNVVAISAGTRHSVALRSDGNVVVWGSSDYGVKNVPSSATNAVQIAAGGYHNLALLEDGQVVAWGDNTYGACNVPASLTNVVEIAAGAYHSVARLSDGSIVAWGQNDFGQSDDPVGITNATGIAAGGYHNLAIHSLGDVTSWGSAFYGLGTIPSNTKFAVSVEGGRHFSMALVNPTHPLYADSDNDGINDGLEVHAHITNPTSADTDNDGMKDGWEVDNGLQPTVDDALNDKDGDLLLNIDEYNEGTDPNDSDSDDDGLTDGAEVHTHNTDPLDSDSDDDGLSDAEEVNTHGTNPNSADSDGDGLTDEEEINNYGTSPVNSDSDGDGLSDGQEVNTYNTNPKQADTDGDGFDDAFEVNTGFDPTLDTSTPDLYSRLITAVEFQFYAANGASYRVEATDDLTDSWEVVETDIIGQGGVVSRLYSIEGQTNKFFRVRRN